MQIQGQHHVKVRLAQYDQADFLINTEDTLLSFTTYAPLTFHKGDFQVSKAYVFHELRYCQPKLGCSETSNLEQQMRKKTMHFKVAVSKLK